MTDVSCLEPNRYQSPTKIFPLGVMCFGSCRYKIVSGIFVIHHQPLVKYQRGQLASS
jgi:hypothetical protein